MRGTETWQNNDKKILIKYSSKCFQRFEEPRAFVRPIRNPTVDFAQQKSWKWSINKELRAKSVDNNERKPSYFCVRILQETEITMNSFFFIRWYTAGSKVKGRQLPTVNCLFSYSFKTEIPSVKARCTKIAQHAHNTTTQKKINVTVQQYVMWFYQKVTVERPFTTSGNHWGVIRRSKPWSDVCTLC